MPFFSVLIIIIDSSHQLLYTGILTGRTSQVKSFVGRMNKALDGNNLRGKWHWGKLSRKSREALKRPLSQLFSEYPYLHLNVLQHRKPEKVDSKSWYIHVLPARIAQKLESWLQRSEGEITLLVDNDYSVTSGGEGTRHFIESLIRQMANRLTGKETSIRGAGELSAAIKQPDDRMMNVYATVVEKNSELVGALDMLLGIYLYEPQLFSEMKNVHYTKIN